ncbi:MAG: hypothetical protein ACTHYS_10490 [Ancrocorticia populi]
MDAIGVNEDVRRYTCKSGKYGIVNINLTPLTGKTGSARLIDMV